VPGLTKAERMIAFVEDLTVTSGKATDQKLTLRPWQRKFVRAVYREDKRGVRPVRTAVLSMARKNGKSQLAAALALCHLCGPLAESRGEVYSCANDRFQSGRIFNEMVALISRHPALSARTNIISFRKEIHDLINGSVYVALTAEAKTKLGLSPSFVIYDELGSADSRALFDAMDSALGARENPLMLVISTQAADDFAPMSQLIDYGLQLKGGEIHDPAFHLTLYSAPEDADPWSRRAWRAANPALGDFRSLSDVERLAKQAQRMPARENAFRNLILNQRVAAEARFIDQAAWRACSGEPNIPVGARVYAGLDLGATRDLSALVIVWQDGTGTFHAKPYCWLPGNLEERSEQDHAPYRAWEKLGCIIPIGPTTDPKAIAHKIAELNGRNHITSLAFDRWRINDLKRELNAIGCHIPVEPHGQGYRDMSPAVDIVERLVIQKKLRHGAHPVLQWCATNAVVTRDPAGGRKFDKAKSTGRIDALVALAMALSLALLRGPKPIDIEAMIVWSQGLVGPGTCKPLLRALDSVRIGAPRTASDILQDREPRKPRAARAAYHKETFTT
jgi:phage terminase large subunit-like protein